MSSIPTDLEVVIDSELAVDLDYFLHNRLVRDGRIDSNAVVLEVRLIAALNRALAARGLQIVEEGGALPKLNEAIHDECLAKLAVLNFSLPFID